MTEIIVTIVTGTFSGIAGALLTAVLSQNYWTRRQLFERRRDSYTTIIGVLHDMIDVLDRELDSLHKSSSAVSDDDWKRYRENRENLRRTYTIWKYALSGSAQTVLEEALESYGKTPHEEGYDQAIFDDSSILQRALNGMQKSASEDLQ